MSTEKIGKIEAICLMLIIVINELIINVPNMIILDTKTGSTLNIIYVSILAVAFAYIICKLFKPFYGKDILDVSEYVGGRVLKIILGVLFILFFIYIVFQITFNILFSIPSSTSNILDKSLLV